MTAASLHDGPVQLDKVIDVLRYDRTLLSLGGGKYHLVRLRPEL